MSAIEVALMLGCHAGIGSLVIYIVGATRKSYDRRTKL